MPKPYVPRDYDTRMKKLVGPGEEEAGVLRKENEKLRKELEQVKAARLKEHKELEDKYVKEV